jgi:hypothetical protein
LPGIAYPRRHIKHTLGDPDASLATTAGLARGLAAAAAMAVAAAAAGAARDGLGRAASLLATLSGTGDAPMRRDFSCAHMGGMRQSERLRN